MRTSEQGASGINTYQVTWRFVVNETLAIGNAKYPTRVVDCEMLGENGNSFHDFWRLWIARDKLLSLKGEYHLYSGYNWSSAQQHSWKVVRMTE